MCSWQSCGDCHHFIVTNRLTYGRDNQLQEEVTAKATQEMGSGPKQDARHVWQLLRGQAEGNDGVEATSPTHTGDRTPLIGSRAQPPLPLFLLEATRLSSHLFVYIRRDVDRGDKTLYIAERCCGSTESVGARQEIMSFFSVTTAQTVRQEESCKRQWVPISPLCA